MRKPIYLLEFNKCEQQCDCGWNMKIGSMNKKALKDVTAVLNKYRAFDLTDTEILKQPLFIVKKGKK